MASVKTLKKVLIAEILAFVLLAAGIFLFPKAFTSILDYFYFFITVIFVLSLIPFFAVVMWLFFKRAEIRLNKQGLESGIEGKKKKYFKIGIALMSIALIAVFMVFVSDKGGEKFILQEPVEVDVKVHDIDSQYYKYLPIYVEGAKIDYEIGGKKFSIETDNIGIVSIELPRNSEIELAVSKEGFQEQKYIVKTGNERYQFENIELKRLENG